MTRQVWRAAAVVAALALTGAAAADEAEIFAHYAAYNAAFDEGRYADAATAGEAAWRAAEAACGAREETAVLAFNAARLMLILERRAEALSGRRQQAAPDGKQRGAVRGATGGGQRLLELEVECRRPRPAAFRSRLGRGAPAAHRGDNGVGEADALFGDADRVHADHRAVGAPSARAGPARAGELSSAARLWRLSS